MDSSVEMLFLLERYLKDETCTLLVTSIKLHNTIEFGSYHATDTKSQLSAGTPSPVSATE